MLALALGVLTLQNCQVYSALNFKGAFSEKNILR